MHTAMTQHGSGHVECKLLDKSVGFKCLASLLGVGHSRIRRSSHGAPDLRRGTRDYQSRPGTWTVDGFLQVAYESIAETLPDQYLELNFTSMNQFLFLQKTRHSVWFLYFSLV